MNPARIARSRRVLSAFLALAATAAAQSAPKNTVTPANLDPQLTALGQSASIDWTSGVITAEGMGVAATGLTEAQARVRARGAAIADAQRLLTAAVWGLQVNSETIVKNYQLESDTIKTQVEGFLQGAQVIPSSDKLDRQSDGSFIYSIRVGAPMYQKDPDYGDPALINIIAPFITKSSGKTSETSGFVAALRAGVRALQFIGRGVPIKASSLTMSAVGTGFQPCVAPKVVSEDGTVVFGNPSRLTSYATQNGLVGYARDQASAAATGRQAPDAEHAELDAVRATGTAKCDLVVPIETAKLLTDRNKQTGFLDDFKV
ncbi:MAG TPA: hypothetical protein VNT60_07960, partial [Deinococcales bacterium]|nr:hypothetical protein [Deinococcales bacterium]